MTLNSTSDGNSFFGSSAGFNNSGGAGNAFFGFQAGFRNANGHDNTFIGFNAGFNNTSGSRNTFIGSSSGNADFGTQVQDSVAIGNGATVSGNNQIVLGISLDKVIVPGTMQVGYSSNTTPMLRVVSIPPANNTFSGHVCFNSQGDLLDCDRSSLRLKTKVYPYRGGLEIVRRLRPINFTWKANGQGDIGLGAEEVAQVAPAFVTSNDKGEIAGVKYDRLNILLINAVKEQQNQIETLRAQNAELNARLRALEKRQRTRLRR